MGGGGKSLQHDWEVVTVSKTFHFQSVNVKNSTSRRSLKVDIVAY
jgi:hypothetical protein